MKRNGKKLLALGIMFVSAFVIWTVLIQTVDVKPVGQKELTLTSMLLGSLTVLFLALTREAYAICVSVLLLVIKGILLLKYTIADR